MAKSSLVMCIGLPGSGKSTWAKEFVKNNPSYHIISSDDILMEVAQQFNITDYSEAWAKVDRKIVDQLFNDRLKYLTDIKADIIWDQTNLTPNTRKKKLQRVSRKNYVIYAKIFDISAEELASRRNARTKAGGKTIPSAVLSQMQSIANFDVSDEKFDIILGAD